MNYPLHFQLRAELRKLCIGIVVCCAIGTLVLLLPAVPAGAARWILVAGLVLDVIALTVCIVVACAKVRILEQMERDDIEAKPWRQPRPPRKKG